MMEYKQYKQYFIELADAQELLAKSLEAESRAFLIAGNLKMHNQYIGLANNAHTRSISYIDLANKHDQG